MHTKLFVQNLTPLCTEEDLQKLFAAFGDVKSARIPTDRQSGRSRGFGFVDMFTQGSADTAVKSLNKKKYNGKMLRVARSKEPEDTPKKRSLAYSYLI